MYAIKLHTHAHRLTLPISLHGQHNRCLHHPNFPFHLICHFTSGSNMKMHSFSIHDTKMTHKFGITNRQKKTTFYAYDCLPNATEFPNFVEFEFQIFSEINRLGGFLWHTNSEKSTHSLTYTHGEGEGEMDSEIRNVTNIHIMPKRRKKKTYYDKFLTLDHQCLRTTNRAVVNEPLGIVAWSQMQTFAMWRFVNLIVVAHFRSAFFISFFFCCFNVYDWVLSSISRSQLKSMNSQWTH